MPDRVRAAVFRSARSIYPGAASLPQRFTGPAIPPPRDAGPDAYPEDTMDDGYDLLAVRIRRGTTLNGAVVALCPDEQGVVTADVCIDGPPVP